MRTIVDFPEKELQAIKALAKREQISQAETIRRAVRQYLDLHQPQPSEEAFGVWANRSDGLSYQEALRQEWPP
ncbi:MAG: ribbon-helix-helix domain-containing protein [Nitrococcus sp.]|nr:ribbon-helix-helix domain-containing protein [Nitrococcus sp.]